MAAVADAAGSVILVDMKDRARGILRDVFGFETYRDRQEEVIGHVLGGGDALVLMPTGGGKSLCYQIPAMVREGVGVVISPLISLMQDQVRALRLAGVEAAFLNSTLSREEAAEIEGRLLAGGLDLVYIAPERLMQERTLGLLDRARLALFAIDEAHCVSHWGHDFRPEYLELSVLGERFPGAPRIALTATADERTRRDIVAGLGLRDAAAFISGFNRPNICYRIALKQGEREQLLRFMEEEHKGDSGIVYCLSRQKTENLAEWLRGKGWEALPYHAGMAADARRRNQERFQSEPGVVIVATIAFGMGIDKPDVRFVAHLDLPKSVEAYYQETGRAGRDGLAADAWMAYGLQDVIKLRHMLDASEADAMHKRAEQQKLNAMLGVCELTTCRRQALLGYFGEDLPEPCGNCDTCLEPVDTFDGTEAAQKALSAAHRTGERFGVSYLVDVLLGHRTDRIVKFGHDTVSTFGIGEELSATQWRSVFRQLVAGGLLAVDEEGFGSLELTEKCRPVLRGEERLFLRKEVARREKKAKKKARKRGAVTRPEDEALYEALSDMRRAIAEREGVPAYYVFGNATLAAMATHRPQDRTQMREISGVGDVKLERYGDDFLDVIERHG